MEERKMRPAGRTEDQKTTERRAAADRKAATNLARIMARLLLDPWGWNIEHLRQDLQISRSTFYKYLRSLRDLQIQELMDEQHRSRIVVQQKGDTRYLRLKVLEVPPEQRNDFFSLATALQMLRQMTAFLEGTDLRRPFDELVREVENHIRQPAYARNHLLRRQDRAIVVLPGAPKNYCEKGRTIRHILQALEGTFCLRITYVLPEGRSWTRVVQPLTLLVHDSALYLLVRSPEEGHVYTLAVERIQNAERTGKNFVYPRPDEYNPLDYTEGAFGLMTDPEGEQIEVELLFANKPWLKSALRERQWHKTQNFFEMPDGRLRMTFTVRSMVGVWPWIRSYGNLVEVVKPDQADPEALLVPAA